MARKTIFLDREDIIIQSLVKSHNKNINYAFDLASGFMKKTPKQIKKRWYYVLRYRDPLFVTASGESSHYNTKNVWRKKPRPDMRVSSTQSKRIIGRKIKN